MWQINSTKCVYVIRDKEEDLMPSTDILIPDADILIEGSAFQLSS